MTIEAEREQYRVRMRAEYIARVTSRAECEQSRSRASQSQHNATLSVKDSQRYEHTWILVLSLWPPV